MTKTARRARGEHGFSEAVQWAVLSPLLALLVLGAVQIGIWLHGRTLAEQAAAGAAESAAQVGGDAARADATARRLATDLRDVDVRVELGPQQVTVTVVARTYTFVDLGQGRIEATASRPREERR